MPSIGMSLVGLGAVLTAVLALGAAGAASAAPLDGRGLTSDEGLASAVIAEVNELRADAGATPLTASSRLGRSSAAHALEMATAGYFGHTSKDGTSFTERIRQYYPRTGAKRRYRVGETLLWSARPVLTAEMVISQWLASASHRTTLLTRHFREIGVAVYHVPRAPGAYGGRDVTLVVVNVGRRG